MSPAEARNVTSALFPTQKLNFLRPKKPEMALGDKILERGTEKCPIKAAENRPLPVGGAKFFGRIRRRSPPAAKRNKKAKLLNVWGREKSSRVSQTSQLYSTIQYYSTYTTVLPQRTSSPSLFQYSAFLPRRAVPFYNPVQILFFLLPPHLPPPLPPFVPLPPKEPNGLCKGQGEEDGEGELRGKRRKKSNCNLGLRST